MPQNQSPSVQQLSQLDNASSQFSDQLTTLLSKITNRDQVSNLSAEDALWLAEYLDNILVDNLTPASSAFGGCLSVLVRICRTWRILPKSCILPGTPLVTSSSPFASGAVADTYEGTLNGTNVCVKQTRTHFTRSNEDMWLDMSYQEAIMWKHVRHPNIVPFLGITSSSFQLVSKWMSGGSLMQYVREQPSANLLSLLLGIAEGLNYFHTYNIVHGDLKGSSILVDELERACLADFGLSAVTPDPEPTGHARKCYSIRWAAPEILGGEAGISKEADVYAFGMVVIEVSSRAAPFADNTPVSVVTKVLLGERPKRPNDPIMTNGLWALTQRCLEEDPRRRPEIKEVVCYLQGALAAQQDRTCVTDVKMDNATAGSTHRWDLLCQGTRSRFYHRFMRLRKLKKTSPESECTPGKACSTKSKESWDSLQRVGSRSYSDPREGVQCIPSGSRNLLQKAGFWLMNCGAPSAHDNQDGISILLAEQRPHIVVDAYKAGTIHQDGESRRKTNEVLNTASLPGSYGPLRHTDDDTWSGGTPVRLANAPSRTNEWTTSPQADHGIGVPLLTADGPNKLESSELDLPLPVDPEALREHHLDLVLHLQGLFSTSCKWLEQGDIKIVGGFPVDAGGYANVWAGTMDDRKVAIKSYRCYLPLDPLPNYVRFYKEALVASRLKHQNVVPFIGAYSTPEHPLALVFDFMEHLNLKAYLGSNMNAKRLELLSDIAHGVEYIHKLNVVHGDIKTTNILVNTDGRARVAGLGAAYALLLVPGVDVDRFSKVHASAPELVYPQLFGLALARATKENDIHGFGALAYEMFGGRAPLFGSDAAGVRPKLGGRSLSRPNHPELSDRLWGVIEGCLESIPHQRKTITEVIAALDAELNPGSS